LSMDTEKVSVAPERRLYFMLRQLAKIERRGKSGAAKAARNHRCRHCLVSFDQLPAHPRFDTFVFQVASERKRSSR
jgi:hypothetical protein